MKYYLSHTNIKKLKKKIHFTSLKFVFGTNYILFIKFDIKFNCFTFWIINESKMSNFKF